MGIPNNPYNVKPFEDFQLVGKIIIVGKTGKKESSVFDCVDVESGKHIDVSSEAGILLITTNSSDCPEICCFCAPASKGGMRAFWEKRIRRKSGGDTYKSAREDLDGILNNKDGEAYLYDKKFSSDVALGKKYSDLWESCSEEQRNKIYGFKQKPRRWWESVTDFDIDKDEDEAAVASGASKAGRKTGGAKAPRNLIYFGAPGTGKSYLLNKDMGDLLGISVPYTEKDKKRFERVTFHPAYTYANFVGTYKPETSGGKITYEYVPGPFMEVYVRAIKDPDHPYLLIIEEINRAEVAAVFGEIFQLLDRDGDGKSMYTVHSPKDVRKYLAQEFAETIAEEEEIDKDDVDINAIMDSDSRCSELCIPGNMYIWATMNSADQGVKPIDTAFKRRWDFQYIGIDKSEKDMESYTVELPGAKQTINWNELRKAINNKLSSLKINEDKLLGPYFLSDKVLKSGGGGSKRMDSEIFNKAFKDKVIMYLFEDAAKAKRDRLFVKEKEDSNLRYSEICGDFDKKGIGIFQFDEDVKNSIMAKASTGTPAAGGTAVPSADEDETSTASAATSPDESGEAGTTGTPDEGTTEE